MKKFKFLHTNHLYYGLLFTLSVVLSSCKNSNDVAPTLEAHDNFLTFKTADEFYKTAEKLSKAPYSEVANLEKQHNFTSLRTLLKEAEEEDAANHEREIKLVAENPTMATMMTHQIPQVVKDNPNTFFYSKEEGIRLNLIRIGLASLLNKDGIVKIGDKIIQYKNAYTKVIEDGNSKKIDLLEKIKSTDKEAGISVHPVRFHNANKRLDYAYSRSCEGGYGSPLQYRIIVYEEAYHFDEGLYRNYFGGIEIRTLKRGFLGGWYNHATRSQSGSGTVSYNFANNPNSWSTTPIINFSGGTYNIAWDGSPGRDWAETSDLVLTFFNFQIMYSLREQYPYNIYQPQFNSSSTHTWTFGTGGPCSCSI